MNDAETVRHCIEVLAVQIDSPTKGRIKAEGISALADLENAALPRLPDGWRITTMDMSIKGRVACMICRDGKPYDDWFLLTEAQQEETQLYVNGLGRTPRRAVLNAITNIEKE
jgi:hypothetical protein